VVTGFSSGIALIIFSGQIKDLLGALPTVAREDRRKQPRPSTDFT
jgi:hypothetical protein